VASVDGAKMIEQRAIEVEKYGVITIHATKLPDIRLKTRKFLGFAFQTLRYKQRDAHHFRRCQSPRDFTR
jgi:hypothetical protein